MADTRSVWAGFLSAGGKLDVGALVREKATGKLWEITGLAIASHPYACGEVGSGKPTAWFTYDEIEPPRGA